MGRQHTGRIPGWTEVYKGLSPCDTIKQKLRSLKVTGQDYKHQDCSEAVHCSSTKKQSSPKKAPKKKKSPPKPKRYKTAMYSIERSKFNSI